LTASGYNHPETIHTSPTIHPAGRHRNRWEIISCITGISLNLAEHFIVFPKQTRNLNSGMKRDLNDSTAEDNFADECLFDNHMAQEVALNTSEPNIPKMLEPEESFTKRLQFCVIGHACMCALRTRCRGGESGTVKRGNATIKRCLLKGV
jgi:hypothetical protein